MNAKLFLTGSLILAAGLESCTSDNDPNAPAKEGNEPVAISLGSTVNTASNVISRAPVASGNIQIGIAGWEKEVSGNYNTGDPQETFSAGALWTAKASCDVSSTDAKTVTWASNEQQYYNANEKIKTTMKAWYPVGTVSDDKKTVTFDNTNGEVDPLWATPIWGDKWNNGTANEFVTTAIAKNLQFAHPTAQIKFSIKAGDGLHAGTTLSSITLEDVQIPTGFNLCAAANQAVTYATAVDLAVPGYTTDSQTINSYTTTAKSVGNPVMIKPITGNKFKVTVKTKCNGVITTYENKDVTVNTTNIEAGKAYTITLTFKQQGIELTAAVTAWENQTGSASIM